MRLHQSLRVPLALALAVVTVTAGAQAQETAGEGAAPSGFGCSEFEFSQAMPAIEGKDGVFFRTYADLRLQHPLGEAVRGQMGRLSRALADRGTTLVYVAIPTKSQAMPGALPDRALDYGYDAAIAQNVYDEVLAGLRSHGIIAPDIMRALQGAGTGADSPMFAADFHWSASGARAAAQAIGAAIRADASYTGLTTRTFESQSTGTTTAFSGTRRSWQGFCTDTLPRVETLVWETVETTPAAEGTLDIGLPTETAVTETAGDEAALDIFADAPADGKGPDIVLVGTSFSDSDVNNFAGFLQEYSGLEVVNYAITGGNQFGAIASYLTSPEFQDAPPHFLIWENPIYNNLGQFGPGQIEELIAAASAHCSIDLGAMATGPDSLSIDLSAFVADGSAGRDASILIDFGAEGARSVEVEMKTTSGILRQTRIERGDRLRPTGRFYLDLGGVWMPDLATVSVRFDRALPTTTGAQPGLFLCSSFQPASNGVSQ